MTFSEFLAMGGYAAYVWPSFGIALVVMLVVLLVSRRSFKAREETLEALEADRRTRLGTGSEGGAS